MGNRRAGIASGDLGDLTGESTSSLSLDSEVEQNTESLSIGVFAPVDLLDLFISSPGGVGAKPSTILVFREKGGKTLLLWRALRSLRRMGAGGDCGSGNENARLSRMVFFAGARTSGDTSASAVVMGCISALLTGEVFVRGVERAAGVMMDGSGDVRGAEADVTAGVEGTVSAIRQASEQYEAKASRYP